MSPELNYLLVLKRTRPEPKVVVHCGSTLRAMKEFEEWRLKDTLEGHIVLTIGANKNDIMLGITLEDAMELDILHLFKIERADDVAKDRSQYLKEFEINHGKGPQIGASLYETFINDKMIRDIIS